jgi:hypothetical protein
VDIDSFSDAAPEVRKKVIPDAGATPSIAAPEAVASQFADPVGEASAEFVKELELTIRKDEDPAANVPLVEVRESLPEGQDPSPSIAAFNKSFSTSHHGELLSVGREVTKNRDGTPRILTLWESPALIDEKGRKVRTIRSKELHASPGKWLNLPRRMLLPLRVNLLRVLGRSS